MSHRVIIIGAGFGGLYAAKTFKHTRIEVTLCDRRNFHLFQPLLYQVATGGLSPGDISSPIRAVLKHRKHVKTLMVDVRSIDLGARTVSISSGVLEYDSLIVATGSCTNYFGKDQWQLQAPGLKTVEDAIEIRRRILAAFEAAELEPDPERRKRLLTFLIVGGGPTGVELAGAIVEIAFHTLKNEFRKIDPSHSRVVLVEGGSRILSAMPKALSRRATRYLQQIGVHVLTDTVVRNIEMGKVTLQDSERTWEISAGTVVWAAGVKASPIGRIIAEGNRTILDEAGRVTVEADLSLPGHPEVFVIGDLARYHHQGAAPLPALAPVAMQQGRYVARAIEHHLANKTTKPFRYHDRGNLATLGRANAVGVLGKFQMWGYPAWLIWLFVHLMYLVEFENRLLVFTQWLWNYITRNRGARLITPQTTANLDRKTPKGD